MVYMAGDSSLSSMVDPNLEEIGMAGSSGNTKILVLADKAGDGNARLLDVKKNGTVELPLQQIWLKRPNEVETGRMETLQSFVGFGVSHYKADHYLLIIWGHGDGWKGAAQDSDDFLTLPEMREALAGYRMDIIAFDACSMATMECYAEIEGYCSYIIASQKTMPTAGMPYGEILGNLTGKSPVNAGKMIVDKYMTAYSTKKKDPESFSLELSLLRTGSGLTQGFREYANGSTRLDLTRRIGFENPDLADLGSVIADSRVAKLVGKTVVKIGAWNNPEGSMNVNGACGMSIYCPKGAVDSEYNATMLAMSTGWVSMMQRAGR